MTTFARKMRSKVAAERRMLKRMLNSINCQTGVSSRKGRLTDFACLHQLLEIAAELAERGHQTNERRSLMPLLRERCPPLGPVLDRLAAEQERGKALLDDVMHALVQCESADVDSDALLAAAIANYLEVTLGQLQVEENYILPVAADYLTPLDWAWLASAHLP